MRYTLLIPSIIFLNRQEFSLSRQVLGIGFEFWFSFLFGFFWLVCWVLFVLNCAHFKCILRINWNTTADYRHFFNQAHTFPNRFNPDLLQIMKCSLKLIHTVHFLLTTSIFFQHQLHWHVRLNISQGHFCWFPDQTKRTEVIKFTALLVICSQIQYWIAIIWNRNLKKSEYFELNRCRSMLSSMRFILTLITCVMFIKMSHHCKVVKLYLHYKGFFGRVGRWGLF